MPPAPISIDSRYLAAWNEINARIAQRQALISIYTSLALASIGVPLLQDQESGLWRLAYAVPPLSVLFAMLLRMHERMIQLLNDFLAACERWGSTDLHLSYYANSEWSEMVGRVRRIHDWVCFTLVLGLNVVTAVLIVFGPHAARLSSVDVISCIMLTGVAGYALCLIQGIELMRLRDPKRRLEPPPDKQE